MGYDHLGPRTPRQELDDGSILTESVAICRYIEGLHPAPALMGADALDAARIEMWNQRLEIEIFTTLGNIARHTFDFFADKLEQVPAFAEAQKRMATKKWQWLDGELADGRPYVAGERFSVADITGTAALMLGDFVGVEIPASLDHVHRWNDSLRSRASWDA